MKCQKERNCLSPNCYLVGPTGPTGLIGPTGPTGPSGSVLTSAYGGLYHPRVQFIVFPAVNSEVVISLSNALPSQNVMPNTNNTLTINESGDYEITYNILLSTSQPCNVAVAVRQNGTVLLPTRGSQTLALDSTTTISYDGRLSATSIVTLNSGDVLDLVISILNTLPNDLDAIINNNANATLTVRKLS